MATQIAAPGKLIETDTYRGGNARLVKVANLMRGLKPRLPVYRLKITNQISGTPAARPVFPVFYQTCRNRVE